MLPLSKWFVLERGLGGEGFFLGSRIKHAGATDTQSLGARYYIPVLGIGPVDPLERRSRPQ
jgi:hypothetical protein